MAAHGGPLQQCVPVSAGGADAGSRVADTRHLRDTFGRFASGVTVVTCQSGSGVHGMTANSFVSVSLEPARALISIAHGARMHGLLRQAGGFGLSVLGEDQAQISRHFAGRPLAGFTPVFNWLHGVPLIDGAVAQMVCAHDDAFDVGDHTLFIGRLIDCTYRAEASPLVYFGGNYAALAAPAQPRSC